MSEGQPGLIVLMSSGETSPSGRRVYNWMFGQLAQPVRMAILETPAGFQPNSAIVAGNVAEFIQHRLQNYRPHVTVVPARRRGTSLSPDDPQIVEPLLSANVLYAGAGSPTYAVRQLQNSLAWHTLLARHRLGAALILASAATIAASSRVLPVYEIYKAGEDLHWREGLDLLGPFNLPLAFVSHWDNTEGGAQLDTSRGFVGKDRFQKLRDLLPREVSVVGIDEHTALLIDLVAGTCQPMGRGGVCLCADGEERRFGSGEAFAITELGPFRMPLPHEGIPPGVWEWVRTAQLKERAAEVPQPSAEVLALVQEREQARSRREWQRADALRRRITALGWEIRDTPNGAELKRSE